LNALAVFLDVIGIDQGSSAHLRVATPIRVPGMRRAPRARGAADRVVKQNSSYGERIAFDDR
jgi:hypothetical protein